MMRKEIAVLLAVIISVFSAGCSSSETSETQNQTQTDQPQTSQVSSTDLPSTTYPTTVDDTANSEDGKNIFEKNAKEVVDVALISNELNDDFNAWKHIDDTIELVAADVICGEYRNTMVYFNSYLFPVSSNIDLSEYDGKKIHAYAQIKKEKIEYGKDSDHYKMDDSIYLNLSQVEEIGDSDGKMEYRSVGESFKEDNLHFGQIYEFENAYIESNTQGGSRGAYDYLYYNPKKDFYVNCNYARNLELEYRFDYNAMFHAYKNKKLHCIGVIMGDKYTKVVELLSIEIIGNRT